MSTKSKKITMKSGQWYSHQIPCVIIKHKVAKSDPTYKFVLNSNIHIRSDVAVSTNYDQTSYFYDLSDILNQNNSVVTGNDWIDFLASRYNISLAAGTNYYSTVFPEQGFQTVEDRDLFDTLHESLYESILPNGLNVLIDFTMQWSGGFIRNKIGIDTNNIQPWIIQNLSLNLLSLIMYKDTSSNNFKVKNSFKSALGLQHSDVNCLEELFKYSSSLLPLNNNNVNYFWDYLNKFLMLDQSLAAKEYLLNFKFDKAQIIHILNKDFSLDVDNNNNPMNIKVKHGSYTSHNNRININLTQ